MMDKQERDTIIVVAVIVAVAVLMTKIVELVIIK
tara:strand:- start:205 stop:306 length:102 start_codon:yes stop_codon:yes gene_type:complete